MFKKRELFFTLLIITAAFAPTQEDIFKAVAKGKIEIVRELIAQNSTLVNEKDTKGRTPLHIAAESGFVKIMELLIKNGALIDAVDDRAYTPLQSAIAQGQNEAVKILLDSEADIYAGGIGRSAFFQALDHGNIEVVEMFLGRGTNINEPDVIGWYPIIYAARQCNYGLMEFLIEKGADVNVRDNNEDTPLMIIAYKYESGVGMDSPADLTKLLIKAGEDIDAKGRGGWSVLHSAVWFGHAGMVKVLIDAGADITIKADDGRTPLDFAIQQGRQPIIDMLENLEN